MCWQAAGTCQLLFLQITIFKLNSEAFVHIVCVTKFLRWFLSIIENCISPLIKNWCPGWRPSYICPQFELFSQGCCCCCNCFYPYCSSHLLFPSAVAAAAVVASTAADILAVAVVAGAAAALLAAADEVTAAVLAAAVIYVVAAIQAAAVVKIAVLMDGDEWFLLSIKVSHLLLLACSLLLFLRGHFFLPCLWEHPAAAVVVAAAVVAASGCGLKKKLYSSLPSLVSKISSALIPLATQSLYSCKM
jgi:hypothetical protein